MNQPKPPSPPVASLTRMPARPPRSSREEPVPAPPGYRWHLDVDSMKWGTSYGRQSIGDLELVDEDAQVGSHGILYAERPIPGKKHKTRTVFLFARVSRTIYSRRSIRRISRALVREHDRLTAEERELAREQLLAQQAVTAAGPGGAR